jgi:hypothetical protein
MPESLYNQQTIKIKSKTYFKWCFMKVGTQDKPLKLTLDKSNRPLINNYISTRYFNFKDLKADKHNYFLFNIAGNHFISKGAMRIATFLYSYFFVAGQQQTDNWQDGQLFYISDNPDTNEKIKMEVKENEENAYFCIVHQGDTITYYRPYPDLVDVLSNFGIEMSASNLNKALKELHEFHYITVSPEPTPSDSRNLKKNTRHPIRHIRLYQGMIDKAYFCHLKDKEKFTRKRKPNKTE